MVPSAFTTLHPVGWCFRQLGRVAARGQEILSRVGQPVNATKAKVVDVADHVFGARVNSPLLVPSEAPQSSLGRRDSILGRNLVTCNGPLVPRANSLL